MYKIRLQRYWHFQQMGKVTRSFCWHQNFVHKGLSAPAPELYTSEFKEICLKLATNGWSDKGFLLTSKVCPQGVFCPCPRAIYMYKIITNVYKIRFQRDHFETCNIWAKKKGLSVVIKILSPMNCLPVLGAIYIWWNMKKCIKNQTSRQFFWNMQQMGKVIGALRWHQILSPRGCVPLPQGYIKSLKKFIKSDFCF